jgi:hypothetical protein
VRQKDSKDHTEILILVAEIPKNRGATGNELPFFWSSSPNFFGCLAMEIYPY